MLKKLRIKLVCLVMAIVLGMLCMIFGLVIHFTGQALQTQALQTLQTIAEDPFQLGIPGSHSGGVQLPYFAVQISYTGELIAARGGYYDLSDTARLLKITGEVLRLPEQQGVLAEYGLRFQKNRTLTGQQIVFVDMSSERATMYNLIRSCILIGLCSFGAFLAAAIALAYWLVRPVEQAWQQQRRFVADASHELKTPLTVIMTNAEMLQGSQYDQQARQRLSENILTMSRQMRGLVEGLLELARVDNGAVKTHFAQLDYSALTEEGLLPFEALYFEKGLTLESRIQPGLHLRGSSSHLHQVLEILLDNALKYASPGSTVRLDLERHGSHSLLAVSSQGAPISQEDLKNIFKRFYRVDKARSRDGSYGLGLSIAESIVQEHGGRIWAESREGENTFFVQLPVTG